jgi:hypothetical protein
LPSNNKNMEENVSIETLADYKDLFTEYINGKDITKISNDLNLSKSKVYTYLNGGVPNNDNAKEDEQRILNLCKQILIERGEFILKSLKND